MGMKYLDEPRLDLWRKAVFLFRKQNTCSGPFAKCGYTQYVIEYKMGKRAIDIVAWDPKKSDGSVPYYALELTIDPEPNKSEQLEYYANSSPDCFLSIGIQSDSSPIVVFVTPSFVKGYDDYCQLELSDIVVPYNLCFLKNPDLERELSKTIDFSHIPQTSFTIVPESKGKELRLGLIDSIMSMFSPGNTSFTAADVTNLALDFIADNIDRKRKKRLIKSINFLLKNLFEKELKGYATFDKGRFTLTDVGMKVHNHPNSRNAFQVKLKSWAKSNNTILPDFSDSD